MQQKKLSEVSTNLNIELEKKTFIPNQGSQNQPISEASH